MPSEVPRIDIHKRALVKPDGRTQILYSRRPIADAIAATSPQSAPQTRRGHLRYHPLLKEWIVYAAHRQARTFLPPPEYNPLAPSGDARVPTEMPDGDYDASVFENLFPSLGLDGAPPELCIPTAPAAGATEVVVYTRDPRASLGSLELSHVELVLYIWADRYKELGSRPDVQYVFCFENRGPEVGVTLHHPHGQIYAYPFLPPIPARELASQSEYYAATGRNLLEDHIQKEIQDGRRILYLSEHAVAFIPAFARYAYEVWVAPVHAAASLGDLSAAEMHDMAIALKTILLKYDRLWEKPFPYLMVWRQAPTDDAPHPEAHVHVEFYPPYRMRGRLKYLAGSELGAGVFTADTYPEEKARELQAIAVEVT